MIRIENTTEVHVFAPFYTSVGEIQDFLNEKAAWIVEKVKEAGQRKAFLENRKFEDGQKFLFLGKKFPLRVIEADVKTCRLTFDGVTWVARIPRGLSARERHEEIRTKMITWYRTQAKEILGSRLFHYTRIMGCEPKRIAIRTQKRIWGSCDHTNKAISLNWKLIFSPIKVIDYVVVHELCHLLVNDHSKRFWEKVAKFMPDYKQHARWLKINALDMVLP